MNEEHKNIWQLPRVRGQYLFNYKTSKLTWFQVGGCAEVLYKPLNVEDLMIFVKDKDPDMPIIVIGAGSNVLIGDYGIKGCVVKLLGKGFTDIKIDQDSYEIVVGAGALNRTVVLHVAEMGFSNLEFLVGIPGSIGGAVVMNAGAYGFEVKDFVKWIEVVHPDGTFQRIDHSGLNMTYRFGNLPQNAIVVSACFQLAKKNFHLIQDKINEYLEKREESQPTSGRTGGSTFKNPKSEATACGKKAWQLIDEAGCRGLALNDAVVSEKHCNFIMNRGSATAYDIAALGEMVRQKVWDNSGIHLEWEIIHLGQFFDVPPQLT